MNEELTLMQPDLQASVIKAEKMSQELEKDKHKANKRRTEVEEDKKGVDKKAAEVTVQYNIATKELNAVMPIL